MSLTIPEQKPPSPFKRWLLERAATANTKEIEGAHKKDTGHQQHT